MIPFRESGLPATVPETVMAAQYAALRTPVKHGAVCRFEDTLTDSPSVWYQDGRWYMSAGMPVRWRAIWGWRICAGTARTHRERWTGSMW